MRNGFRHPAQLHGHKLDALHEGVDQLAPDRGGRLAKALLHAAPLIQPLRRCGRCVAFLPGTVLIEGHADLRFQALGGEPALIGVYGSAEVIDLLSVETTLRRIGAARINAFGEVEETIIGIDDRVHQRLIKAGQDRLVYLVERA